MRLLRFLVVLASNPANAQPIGPENEEPPIETPFDRGKKNLSVAGGTSNTFGQRYFGIGAGFGYFVLDGLELGASALVQFGDGPSIARTAPQIRYVAQPLVGKWPLIPYAGVFYTHWFIDGGFDDIDAVGARGGLLYISGHILLGLGIAVEKTVSTCAEESGQPGQSGDCVTAYPDLTISLSF